MIATVRGGLWGRLCTGRVYVRDSRESSARAVGFGKNHDGASRSSPHRFGWEPVVLCRGSALGRRRGAPAPSCGMRREVGVRRPRRTYGVATGVPGSGSARILIQYSSRTQATSASKLRLPGRIVRSHRHPRTTASGRLHKIRTFMSWYGLQRLKPVSCRRSPSGAAKRGAAGTSTTPLSYFAPPRGREHINRRARGLPGRRTAEARPRRCSA